MLKLHRLGYFNAKYCISNARRN